MADNYETMYQRESPIVALIRHCSRLADFAANDSSSCVPTALIHSIVHTAKLAQVMEFDDGR